MVEDLRADALDFFDVVRPDAGFLRAMLLRAVEALFLRAAFLTFDDDDRPDDFFAVFLAIQPLLV
jgi:hypothetical protein